jgi:Zn-dependent M16 (insulinase) family peptidase
MFFSVGLKGMHPSNAVKVESIVFHTIKELVEQGIDPRDIEAAVNTVEFDLRENNTGSYPRGLSLMFQALSTWLYDDEEREGDPLLLLPFEEPLKHIKGWLASGEKIFEELLARLFLHNPHRTTVLLEPDQKMARRVAGEEAARLKAIRQAMDPAGLDRVMDEARELARLQAEPDAPEALATIPRLSLADLPRENKTIPTEERALGDTPLLFHDLTTNGIAYVDLAFDLAPVPDELLPYVPILGRALTETGTTRRDYVDLSQWIARTSGGIWAQSITAPVLGSDTAASRLLVRAKATAEKMGETADILTEILTSARMDSQERIGRIVSEARARAEQRLVPSGHQVVATRLRARTHAAHAMEERMSGLTGLLFLRDLEARIESDFRSVAKDLERLRGLLLTRPGLVVNATMDGALLPGCEAALAGVLDALPGTQAAPAPRAPLALPEREGLAIPAQVNYVGKGVSVAEHGLAFSGAALAVNKLLRTGYLWEKVRVQGGAYGAFCLLDRVGGNIAFVSYRDPSVAATLHAFDGAADFLEGMHISDDELEKTIIGAIGELDAYQLPDARGFTAMVRHLTGQTDAYLQTLREETLATSRKDFAQFARAVRVNAAHGAVCVLGDEEAMTAADLGLDITRVL